jgi:ATP/maltotriose-dependent transcriptional regulator MalT
MPGRDTAGMGTPGPTHGDYVGRSRELAELRARVAAARAGAGAVVLVTGPPGVGKTRLVEEVAGRAGPQVVWGRAVEDEGAPPLWAWQRVLAAVAGADDAAGAALAGFPAGSSPAAPEAAGARFAVAAAVTDALIAAAGPGGLTIVLEDLHWADEASLYLLRHLAVEVRRSRLLLLATARDDPTGPWATVLPDLLRDSSVHVVPLGPLDERDVAAYLHHLTGATVDPHLVAAVHRCTGGNPLYLKTVAGALGEGAAAAGRDPAVLQQLIASRPELRNLVRASVRGLPAATRPLLQAAAVAGEEIDYSLLAAVTGTTADRVRAGLEHAGAAGVLAPIPAEPGRCRFAHALVRDVVYAELDPDTRAGWHLRAAAALEPQAQVQPERSGEVAAHYLRSARDVHTWRRGVAWARRAAEGATAAFAFVDAGRFLTMAADALQAAGGSAEEIAELWLARAGVAYRAGRYAEMLQHCVTAAEAAERADRADLLAAAALLPRGLGRGGDTYAAAILQRLCGRALAAGPDLSPLVRAGLLAQRAVADAELDDMAAAADAAAQALAVAESANDPRAVLEALRARAMVLDGLEHVTDRLRLGTRIRQLARLVQTPRLELWGTLVRIEAGYQLGDLGIVDEELAHVAGLVAATHFPSARWQELRLRAGRAALAGRFTAARQLSAQAGEVAERMQDAQSAFGSRVFAMVLAAVRGDPDELPDDSDEALAEPSALPLVRAVRARMLFERGHHEDAAAAYEELRRLPAVLQRESLALTAVNLLLELTVAFGDTETAQVMYERLRPFPDRCGGILLGIVFCWGSSSRHLGRLAAFLGRHDDAVAHFHDALAMNGRMGARPLVVLTRLDWADALHGRGQPGDLARADRLVRQAAAEARRLDMPGAVRRAAGLLTRLGQAQRAASPLSPREREVVDLVAAGLSNRDIAARFTLSERTVETHVRNILRKLDLSTRTQVAAWAMQWQLHDPGPGGLRDDAQAHRP